jgi:phospholipase D1/2
MHNSARAGRVRAASASHSAGPAWGKLALIALAVAGLAAVWRYTPLRDHLTPERIFDWTRTFGGHWWAPLAVVAAYTPACFTMFPRPLITLFAVIAFEPVPGFVYAMSGILVASLVTYYAGRLLRKNTVRHLAGAKIDAMTAILRKRGLAAVFAVRIIPIAPFAIEGMVAGRIPIKLWHFMLGTFLGMLPGTLTTTVFGDQIQTALEDPSRIHWGLVSGVIIFFVVLTLMVRRWFAGQQRKPPVADDRP